MKITLVILACSALQGSAHKDHCEEHRFPMVVDTTPQACVVKAQEVIAAHPEAFEGTDILSWGCDRRKVS